MNQHGSELSTVETDVYVWQYALLVVLAIKKEEKDIVSYCHLEKPYLLTYLRYGTSQNQLKQCTAHTISCATLSALSFLML